MYAKNPLNSGSGTRGLFGRLQSSTVKNRSDPPNFPFSTCRALILQVETTVIRVHLFVVNSDVIQEHTLLSTWDPHGFLNDQRGLRLLEEIARRIQPILLKEKIDCVVLSLPGTLDGAKTIDGSSRLGIFETINVTSECKKLRLPPTYVFHDAECLALGEALSNISNLPQGIEPGNETLVYLIVDEGVGSSIFIDGKPYRGAGVAGHIGRLVMHPSGPFSPAFNSRGTLEVFAARPWISHNVVNEYLSEKDKRGAIFANSNPFRAAVAAAAASGKTQMLTFSQLNEGVKESDPILLSVLEDAAQNLSVALNAIITILNPPLILMGGGMITEVSGFHQKIIDYTRRCAYAGSWNSTTIKITNGDKDNQVRGAAYFISRLTVSEI